MAIRLSHVVKLGETLFDSGARLVVLRGFHCSHWGDVRTAGMDFNYLVLFAGILEDKRLVAFVAVHNQ